MNCGEFATFVHKGFFFSCREHHEKSRHRTVEVQTVWDYSQMCCFEEHTDVVQDKCALLWKGVTHLNALTSW